MQWKYISIFLFFISLTVSVLAADFSKYQVILNRKPFGTVPPPPPAAPPPQPKAVPPSQSFAKQIRLCALVEDDEGNIQVGVMNLATQSSFYLTVGNSEEGIELVSADYENEEAILRKGTEMAVIKIQSGEIEAISPQEAESRISKGRASYAERRRLREERRAERQAQPPPEPMFKGEELQKHLQEYQLEVIRQGLPPLPIPLTEEMDRTLVEEGVLPPQ